MKYVIIGNGIAGLTASRMLRKKRENSEIKLIGNETEYPFSRPGLMYINVNRLLPEDLELYERWFYRKNRIDLIYDTVTGIDRNGKTVELKSGDKLNYDNLLIATGTTPRMFNWKNNDLEGIYTYNNMQHALKMCENFKTGKKAVVVGGGLTGLEVVECLNFHGIDVKYLVREKWFFDKSLNEEEALIVHRIMEKKGVELMLEEEIGEFIGENGKLTGIKTNKGNEIECDLAYITIGVVPNISLAKNASLKTDRGIIVNEYQQTSDENIYAAGDCAEIPDPVTGTTIELLWYTARDQGRVAGYNMAKIPTKYKPGIFYNSARFFEVDYLTVGKTQNLNENEKVYAKYKNDKKISMRICYNDEHVIGFNMLGLRWKKDVLESFIIERKNLDYVLNNLKRAAFNPEFSKNYVKEIINV